MIVMCKLMSIRIIDYVLPAPRQVYVCFIFLIMRVKE